MYELALFAGAGGGILGGHLLGWRTVCAVEYDPYARDVLLARQNDGCLPPFPVWDDVRTFRADNPGCAAMFAALRAIADRLVISGGFPCQDISAAGKGAGIDGERSGLWGEQARIISEIRPSYCWVENSPMLLTARQRISCWSKWWLLSLGEFGCGKSLLSAHDRMCFASWETLPRWGMMRNGELWERTMPEPLTNETGSGSVQKFPTPHGMSKDGKSNGPSGNELGRAVNQSLRFPTPTANEDSYRLNGDSQQSKSLGAMTRREAIASGIGGSLNPTWVEWLMGWPLGWTDCAASATDKFRKWCESHGVPCKAGVEKNDGGA